MCCLCTLLGFTESDKTVAWSPKDSPGARLLLGLNIMPALGIPLHGMRTGPGPDRRHNVLASRTPLRPCLWVLRAVPCWVFVTLQTALRAGEHAETP